MPRTTAFANDYMKFICHGTTIAALSGVTTFYVSLHTASPGLTGTQATSECAYTGYARKAINRNSTDLPVTNNVAALADTLDFIAATGGAETATYFGVGTSATGGGYLLWYGPLTPEIPITVGTEPKLGVGTTFTAL